MFEVGLMLRMRAERGRRESASSLGCVGFGWYSHGVVKAYRLNENRLDSKRGTPKTMSAL